MAGAATQNVRLRSQPTMPLASILSWNRNTSNSLIGSGSSKTRSGGASNRNINRSSKNYNSAPLMTGSNRKLSANSSSNFSSWSRSTHNSNRSFSRNNNRSGRDRKSRRSHRRLPNRHVATSRLPTNSRSRAKQLVPRARSSQSPELEHASKS